MLVLAAGGCRPAQVGQPLAPALAGNDAHSQTAFWHTLHERPVASNEAAFHGLLLFIDGHDPHTTYGQRVAGLKQRGLLAPGFDGPAEHGVLRGTLASALVRVLDIKGGLTMHLIGPHPRYAVRELIESGVLPRSSPHQTLTGAQFVSVMGRAEDFQRSNSNRPDMPAEQLPDEAAPAAAESPDTAAAAQAPNAG